MSLKDIYISCSLKFIIHCVKKKFVIRSSILNPMHFSCWILCSTSDLDKKKRKKSCSSRSWLQCEDESTTGRNSIWLNWFTSVIAWTQCFWSINLIRICSSNILRICIDLSKISTKQQVIKVIPLQPRLSGYRNYAFPRDLIWRHQYIQQRHSSIWDICL